ncbi:RES family NAD+ phosphorylase [Anaeromyxobacter paludicola]|nr:RES family NAD+ phosphorylase [Anaeromyxobacter paludicola]
MIDASKPALPPEPAFAGLHYLLYTPFRYPPLRHGSRFGRRHERALWYGAEELATALAEVAYYRLLFFEGTAAQLAPDTITVSAFQARIRTSAGVDLTDPVFKPYLASLCSKTSYAQSQALGSEMRADGIEVVRYPSARHPGQGLNLALFTPAFAAKTPVGAPQTWYCTVTPTRDVEFRYEAVAGVQKVDFPRKRFLVRGALPAPAL